MEKEQGAIKHQFQDKDALSIRNIAELKVDPMDKTRRFVKRWLYAGFSIEEISHALNINEEILFSVVYSVDFNLKVKNRVEYIQNLESRTRPLTLDIYNEYEKMMLYAMLKQKYSPDDVELQKELARKIKA